MSSQSNVWKRYQIDTDKGVLLAIVSVTEATRRKESQAAVPGDNRLLSVTAVYYVAMISRRVLIRQRVHA